jgi:hypothetical protein
MVNKLKQAYPISGIYKRLQISFFVSLFIFLFLFTLEPFDLNLLNASYKTLKIAGYGIVSLLGLIIFYVIPPQILITTFDDTKWNLSKELMWLLLNVLIIGLLLSFYESFICIRPLSFIALFETIGKAMIIGLLPITVVTLLNQNIHLHKNLQKAKSANSNLKNIRKNNLNKHGLITIQSDISETLSFSADDFILSQEEDNYTTFFLEQDGKIKSTLLRITLKNTEMQLQFPFIQRCHRSYLVNLLKIETINGNANGYKLLLANFSKEIPVSRQNSKSILQAIGNLAEPTDAN